MLAIERLKASVQENNHNEMIRNAEMFASSLWEISSDPRTAKVALSDKSVIALLENYKIITSFRINGLTNVFQSLAALGFKIQNRIHKQCLFRLFKQITNCGSIKANSFGLILKALHEMGFQWSYLQSEARRTILSEQIPQSLPTRALPHDIAYLLDNFCKMGMVWRDIPEITQYALLDAMYANIEKYTLRDGPLLLSSLGKLKFNVRTTRPFFSRALASRFETLLEECEQLTDLKAMNKAYGRIMSAMAQLQFVYTDFPKPLQQLLLSIPDKQMQHMNGGELSWTLYGMGGVCVPWDKLSEVGQLTIQACIMHTYHSNMNEFDKSGTWKGLGGMNIQYSALEEGFRTSMEKSIVKEESQMNIQFAARFVSA